MNLPAMSVLTEVYGETQESSARFESLAKHYAENFGSEQVEFFSAPGRTEIVGNHTDHNGGKILAASIGLDTIGAAAPNGTRWIRIVSEGYPDQIEIDLSHLEQVPKNQGTISLLAGIAVAVRERGYEISGFHAYISTNVISSAGVSSSASFEMLICSMINYFFNAGQLSYVEYAKIGQYAENHYWDKSSGLMDQMACAVGGAILLDFKEDVSYQKVPFAFEDFGYRMFIINTGKGHADLSAEYSGIPIEMRQVAEHLDVARLADTSMEELVDKIPELQKAVENDRSILRSMHFFAENERVLTAVRAIAEKNPGLLLQALAESGQSSWELLQNCYTLTAYEDQKIPLYLSLTELFIKQIGDGCCRIHGGGFAGVIMSIIPVKEEENYISYISRYVGRENVYPMNIRSRGAIHLNQ